MTGTWAAIAARTSFGYFGSFLDGGGGSAGG